mmetsp:Transcript_21363/g.48170  ORF Transcript_21363/g.48170 Transcript_21363/m.48170 type:complete len:193 (-) Transcript_21363:32-610(-)
MIATAADADNVSFTDEYDPAKVNMTTLYDTASDTTTVDNTDTAGNTHMSAPVPQQNDSEINCTTDTATQYSLTTNDSKPPKTTQETKRPKTTLRSLLILLPTPWTLLLIQPLVQPLPILSPPPLNTKTKIKPLIPAPTLTPTMPPKQSLIRSRHDNLIHDAYCKKCRHKPQSTSRRAQHSIVWFLSLRGRLN